MSRPKQEKKIKIREPKEGEGVVKLEYELKPINKALEYARVINPNFIPESPLTIFTEISKYLRDHSLNKSQSVDEIAGNNGLHTEYVRLRHLVGNDFKIEDKPFNMIKRYIDAVEYDSSTGTFTVNETVMNQLWYRDHVEFLTGDNAIEVYNKVEKLINAINELNEALPQSFRQYPNSIPFVNMAVRNEGGKLVVNASYLKCQQDEGRI